MIWRQTELIPFEKVSINQSKKCLEFFFPWLSLWFVARYTQTISAASVVNKIQIWFNLARFRIQFFWVYDTRTLLLPAEIGSALNKDMQTLHPLPYHQFWFHFYGRCAIYWNEWKINFPTLVQRINVCSVQIFNKDFFGPIFFGLCPQ